MLAIRLAVGLALAVPFALFADHLIESSTPDRPLFGAPARPRATRRRVVLVIVSMALAALGAWRFVDAPWLEMLGYMALFVVLVALSWIDARDYRLPDVIVLPTLAVGLAVVVLTSLTDDTPTRIRFALVGAVVAFVVLLAAHLASPRGMGFGDVKLAAVLGLAVGWQSTSVGDSLVLVLWLLLVGFAAGTIAGLVLLAMRRRNQPFPFGPFLSIGAVVTVMASRVLLG